MFLSPREESILHELLTLQEPTTIEHLSALLKVSRRTVYRELSSLEDSLRPLGIVVLRQGKSGLLLKATSEERSKLLQSISQSRPASYSTTERQHAILLKLLTTTTPIKMKCFLDDFEISNTTFFSDIKELEKRISHLPLTIDRDRGYLIKGAEKFRRTLMANILSAEINEYQFFHFTEQEYHENYFLHVVQLEHLYFARTVVQEIIGKQYAQLSDRKIKFLILMLVIAMEHVPKSWSIDEERSRNRLNKEYLKVAQQIFGRVSEHSAYVYSVSEVVFFASLLSDFNQSFDNDFFEDSFDLNLAFQVRQVIEEVSYQMSCNFFEDDNLYRMLLTHLSATLNKAVYDEGKRKNPILEKIVEQYIDLTKSIKLVMPKVFPQQYFSEEEIAYIVLHFANSLEKNPQHKDIDIAGISPSGLASMRMLEMRLRRHFPYIDKISFFRIVDLAKIDLKEEFDLVISTALLPGYEESYILVSPLLLEDEVKKIREAIDRIQPKRKSAVAKKTRTDVGVGAYQKVLLLIEEINLLLDRFEIVKIRNEASISQTVLQLLDSYQPTALVDKEAVNQRLMERFRQSPLGIPETNFALFHASVSAVREVSFKIFDLEQAIGIKAMDGATIQMNRVLMMLAPDPIDEATSRMLGKISGAIIMNDLNLEIFNSGNQAIVYQLLSSLLIEEVKK